MQTVQNYKVIKTKQVYQCGKQGYTAMSMIILTGFPLYFGIKIQGLSRTLKLHFHRPILDVSLQHGQY